MFLIKDGYIFNREIFSDLVSHAGFIDLIKRNFEETKIYERPFNPDLDRYSALSAIGAVETMVAWFGDWPVGYSVFFVDSQIYQKEIKTATQSACFVDAPHRGISYPFMKFCDDILVKQGVNSIWRQASAKRDIGRVYERMGYRFVEKSYLREL